MKTVDFDRMSTAAPINRTAVRVTTSKGVHWEPEKDLGTRRWLAPPPMVAITKGVGVDLTGLRRGRLVVVGLVDNAAIGRSSRARGGWVVRCTCGAYELRILSVLRDPSNRAADMCSHCDYLEEVKAGRTQPKDIAERTKAK